jgi:hypothetical protein
VVNHSSDTNCPGQVITDFDDKSERQCAYEEDGVSRQATVTKVSGGQMENVVSKGLENIIERQKGKGTSVETGKVRERMDVNQNQLSLLVSSAELGVVDPISPPIESSSKPSLEQVLLPPSRDLTGCCKTSKCSLHIQNILNMINPQLSSHILSYLLRGAFSPLSLMDIFKPNYVNGMQKLNTIIPSTQLEPMLFIFVSYCTQLSMDSSGCHLVQSMPEFTRPNQQKSIISLLCSSKNFLVLVTDKHGTLSTHHPGAGAACLLQEYILARLSQLVITEPGIR